jgi:hypothetical protein
MIKSQLSLGSRLRPADNFSAEAVYSVMHLIGIGGVSSNNGEQTCQSSSHSRSPRSPRPATIRSRRAEPKFVAKLEEQKLLLKDPNHVRTAQRWAKVDGQRQAVTKQQAVRPW